MQAGGVKWTQKEPSHAVHTEARRFHRVAVISVQFRRRRNARMAKLADARDLKSRVPNRT
jgi:hypothetical protein